MTNLSASFLSAPTIVLFPYIPGVCIIVPVSCFVPRWFLPRQADIPKRLSFSSPSNHNDNP